MHSAKLTVFFEAPYWVGVYERVADGRLTAAKLLFGAEPKDYEVHALLLTHWRDLRFSPSVPVGDIPLKRVNPKRRQRMIVRELATNGTGTKSQQALSAQRDAGRTARKQNARAQKEAKQQQVFEARQHKRKEKHRGR